MIKIRVNDFEEACPLWACDLCGKVHKDKNLNLLYPAVWKRGDESEAMVVCKRCSREKMPAHKTKTHWTQLDKALKQLNFNNELLSVDLPVRGGLECDCDVD